MCEKYTQHVLNMRNICVTYVKNNQNHVQNHKNRLQIFENQ